MGCRCCACRFRARRVARGRDRQAAGGAGGRVRAPGSRGGARAEPAACGRDARQRVGGRGAARVARQRRRRSRRGQDAAGQAPLIVSQRWQMRWRRPGLDAAPPRRSSRRILGRSGRHVPRRRHRGVRARAGRRLRRGDHDGRVSSKCRPGASERRCRCRAGGLATRVRRVGRGRRDRAPAARSPRVLERADRGAVQPERVRLLPADLVRAVVDHARASRSC